MQTNTTTIR